MMLINPRDSCRFLYTYEMREMANTFFSESAGKIMMSRRVPEANLNLARLGIESHFGPVSHEWLYRIAPKITNCILFLDVLKVHV